MSLLISSADPASALTAIFDDDDRVAYLYIVAEEKLAGDVWVYNHGEALELSEWEHPEQPPPYKNPAGFLRELTFAPVTNPDELEFRWISFGRSRAVELWIRDRCVALLAPGMTPGFSELVAKDSPVARVLDEPNRHVGT